MTSPGTAVSEPQVVATAVPQAPPGLARRAWIALSALFAAISGLLPHVLHHAGPLAGAALFAGAAGSVLFGVLGFLAAIPFLLRLHRRFGNWRAPGIALAVFAAVFSISTFVIGPQISGADDGAETTNPPPAASAQPSAGGDSGSADGGEEQGGGGHAGHH